jgi:hypothetical protein
MEESLMSISRQRASAKGRHRHIGRLAARFQEKPPVLGFDRIVDNLAAALSSGGARKVATAVLDKPLSLAVDEKKMDEVFAILGNTMASGAFVSILGGLVGSRTGEDGRIGCALLSVRVAGVQGTPKEDMGNNLPAVQGVVKKQGGAVRFSESAADGEIRFSLYLPLHGSQTGPFARQG